MDLNEITAHSAYPFANFRQDDGDFALLEAYWQGIGELVLGVNGWADIAVLRRTDRDEDEWGNPIMLDFWVPNIRRGAKVELLENTEGLPACRLSEDKINCAPSISVYTKMRAIMGPDDEIEQICFRADMSAVAREVVIELMTDFLIRKLPAQHIAVWFDAFCRRTGEGPTRAQLEAHYASLVT